MVLATVQSSELGSILKCVVGSVVGSVVGRVLGMRIVSRADICLCIIVI